MRGKGINFDTGILSAGTTTRETFDPEIVRREMRVIRDDLHCTAVRITGGDPNRLEIVRSTYRGASDSGRDPAFSVIVWDDDGRAAKLNGEYIRDEHEQATYLRELLEVFAAEGVDTAFVYTFARYDFPHRDQPLVDIDIASAGIVKVLDGRRARQGRYRDMPWEPKAAFQTLADWYQR